MILLKYDPEMTLAEQYAWVPLGWAFCEVSFKCPEWAYGFIGSWCHPLGCWFYGLAYDRVFEDGAKR